MSFVFLDAKGEVFEMPEPVAIGWTGWRRVERPLANFPEGWGHWSGDGVPDYPLRGLGFVLSAPHTEFAGKGVIQIDDVEVVSAPGR